VTAKDTLMPPLAIQVITRLSVGGAQQAAINAAVALSAKGWRVLLVAGAETDEEGSLLGAARRQGLEVVLLRGLVREVRPLDDLRALVGLFRMFRRYRPSVVNTHSSKAGVLGRAAARLARVPVIVHTVHGWSFEQREGRAATAAYLVAERVLAHLTDRLLVVSRSLRESGLAAGVGKTGQYELVRAGEDLSEFATAVAGRHSSRQLLGLSDDVVLAGTVSRLSPPKDPFTLVQAVALVPDLHLLVIGDGPLRTDLLVEIDRLGIADRVRLLGARPDVPRLLGALDLFVLSSKSESLPLSVIEALAAGIPVVASDVGGLRELVHSGSTGVLVPPGDVGRLAAALGSVVGDDQLRKAAVEAGPRAVEPYGLEPLGQALDEAYSAVAAMR
jgi:glycosyltransferase involved in cell wall biosynthesis